MVRRPPRQRGRADQPAVVKKYANRRLYNTATSSYVTLDDLSKMVRAGDHFVVYDAKSGEDLTRSILTQIILEEDGKGRNLLPINFLRQVIGFYDDSLRAFLPRYLELSMENFAAQPGADPALHRRHPRPVLPDGPVRGHGAPEHGAVPARRDHVQAAAWRRQRDGRRPGP